MKLVLPVGGKSTRYNVSRPKWLLTMPSGKLMIEEAISALNLSNIDEIIVISIASLMTPHVSSDKLNAILSYSSGLPVRVISLDQPTNNQPETVYFGLKQLGEDFPFFIKDCDNIFSFTPARENSICFMDLNDIDLINARSKSYVEFDDAGLVSSIIEKKVISSSFCVGGYSFLSSNSFLESFDRLSTIGDLYVSHIIFDMISEGHMFWAKPVSNYEDWGTLREYHDVQSRCSTLFCDFDGVIVENSSKFAEAPWSYVPIPENIEEIKKLKARSAASKIVITTSRPKSEEDNIRSFMLANGIDVHCVVTNLPHCKRILINDYSATNPYPTAKAISIKRNSLLPPVD